MDYELMRSRSRKARVRKIPTVSHTRIEMASKRLVYTAFFIQQLCITLPLGNTTILSRGKHCINFKARETKTQGFSIKKGSQFCH